MKELSQIVNAIRRRREVAREALRMADEEAKALLARGSRSQALYELRQRETADPGNRPLRQHIARVREAVSRLSRHEVRLDTATRMLYRDEL